MSDPSCFTGRLRRSAVRAGAGLLVALGLARGAAAQFQPDALPDSAIVPVGVYGETVFWLEGATLVGLDLPTDSVTVRRDLAEAFGVFEPWQRNVGVAPNPPLWYSNEIDTRAGVLWMWDRSVGATVRVGLTDADTAVVATPRQTSLTQFDHAGGLHPMTGRPLAYGGYGYHRLRDYTVTYDDRAPTWVEIAYRGALRPEPRRAAIMVDGWHPTRVAIVGGFAASNDVAPFAFDRVLDEAWVYDFADSTWSTLDVPDRVRCALRASAPLLGDIAGDRRTRSVLLYEPPSCSDYERPATVLRWFPDRDRLQTVADLPDVPLVSSPLALYLPPDSSSVRMVLERPVEGEPRSTWRRTRFAFVLPDAPVDATTASPWLALPLALGLLLVGIWVVVRRRHNGVQPVRVRLEGDDRIILYRNGDFMHATASPNAIRLLRHLAGSEVRAGADVLADDIAGVLDDLYTEPDSLRVARNRAVAEVNALFRTHFGADLLERVRRTDDARRFDWRVRWSVRMEG